MDIIKLTADNIDSEHICCAFADKKCKDGYDAKKAWLRTRFREEYVFKKLDLRGKVFIEYGPAEYAWAPVDAPGYMMIGCFWVSGQFKGHGYGTALYRQCLEDSAGKSGIAVITGKKKMPFLPDKKFFEKQGFELCDTAEPFFELWAKRLRPDASLPAFKEGAKHATCNIREGLAIFYSDACPFTEFYVNTELAGIARDKGIPLYIKKIQTCEEAQNHFVPFTIYSLFCNGKFVTHQIQSRSSFEKLFHSI